MLSLRDACVLKNVVEKFLSNLMFFTGTKEMLYINCKKINVLH